jgi:hypothetical protein
VEAGSSWTWRDLWRCDGGGKGGGSRRKRFALSRASNEARPERFGSRAGAARVPCPLAKRNNSRVSVGEGGRTEEECLVLVGARVPCVECPPAPGGWNHCRSWNGTLSHVGTVCPPGKRLVAAVKGWGSPGLSASAGEKGGAAPSDRGHSSSRRRIRTRAAIAHRARTGVWVSGGVARSMRFGHGARTGPYAAECRTCQIGEQRRGGSHTLTAVTSAVMQCRIGAPWVMLHFS